MAARVTATEVIAIMANAELSTTKVDSFIAGANALVNASFGAGDASAITKEIERWLTAHLLASTIERTASQEAAGGASVTYTGKFGERLSSTPYGQMVLVLDTAGLMMEFPHKQKVSIFAVPNFV